MLHCAKDYENRTQKKKKKKKESRTPVVMVPVVRNGAGVQLCQARQGSQIRSQASSLAVQDGRCMTSRQNRSAAHEVVSACSVWCAQRRD